MNAALLDQLASATTDLERQTIVLEMSLIEQPAVLRRAVSAAAIPHWFDFKFLSALIGEEESDITYDELLDLNFIDLIPGRGYTIHERTRTLLLKQLWESDPAQFRQLSGRAADYCLTQAEDSQWQAEEIYHRLVSDPEQGVSRFQELATEWANFEHSSYEEIEQITKLADEQIVSGRLTGPGANQAHLWQARLALIYGQTAVAGSALAQIKSNPNDDLLLAAEVAHLQGDLAEAQNNSVEMESAWRRAFTLYEQAGQPLDRYLVEEKLRGRNLVPVSNESVTVPSLPSSAANTGSLRTKLLDNIESAWINGVLNVAIRSDGQALDLPLAKGQNHNLRVHRPGGVDQPLSGAGGLLGLFEATGQSLLILGAPGSGKTISLLQLLEALIEKARNSSQEPVPLLFNLSSFGKFEGDFATWLAEQAHNLYSLKRRTTLSELQQGNRYTLLLDGLDEVPNESGEREECVEAINAFTAAHPCGLVVCSRITDYRSLSKKLLVDNAVVLQPLTNQQIGNRLQAVCPPELIALVNENWQLREALRSPLLLNLFPKAMSGVSLDFKNGKPNSIEGWRNGVFATYATKTIPTNDGKSHRKWLRFLARGMQREGTTVFNIDELQASWLPNQNLVGRYRWWAGGLLTSTIGTAAGFVLSILAVPLLIITYIFGLDNNQLSLFDLILATLFFPIIAPLFGLYLSTGFSLGGAVANKRTLNIKSAQSRMLVGGLIAWVVSSLVIGFLGLNIVREFVPNLIRAILGLGFAFPVALLCRATKIEPRDQVRFKTASPNLILSHWRIGISIVLVLGILGGFTDGIVANKPISEILANVIPTFIEVLVITVPTGILTMLMLAVLDTPQINERSRPGAGITASLKNGLTVSLITTLLFGTSGLLLDWWYEAEGQFFILLIFYIFPPIFTWYGGMAWAQHWALRCVLWWNSFLPLRLVTWGDQLTESGLLRRVGGGYIFIHRSLLEFFASEDDLPQ